MENQNAQQKMISFATSDRVDGAIELLKEQRTRLTTVISDTEYKTLLNALTLEIETNLIQRFIIAVEKIKKPGSI